MQVEFLPGAKLDFAESFDWYAKRDREAADNFSSAIELAVERILDQHDTLPVVDARHRECLVKRFPFRIIYRDLPDKILIVAVAHAKRRTRYWRSR